MSEIRVGTSGWSYDHWHGTLYPDDLPKSRELEHYVTVFDTVEINGTFYGTPSETVVRGWYETAPEGFLYAVKGNRYLTHNIKLKDAADSVRYQRDALEPLREKLGPVLWQLSEHFHADAERLADFLPLREQGERWAFEFRHESWFCQEVYALLREHDCALVWADTPDYPLHLEVTADWLYCRLHGHEVLYVSPYDDRQLGWWKARINEASEGRRDSFVYFDNDSKGHAPRDALRLREMLQS